MKRYYPFQHVGMRLRVLRGPVTQAHFSKLVRVPLRSYQRYETGERYIPMESLLKIVDVCGVSKDWILEGIPKSKNEKMLMIETMMDYKQIMGHKAPEMSLGYVRVLQKTEDHAIYNLIKQKLGSGELEKLINQGEEKFSHWLRTSIQDNLSTNIDYKGKELYSYLYLILKQVERIWSHADPTTIRVLQSTLDALDSEKVKYG